MNPNKEGHRVDERDRERITREVGCARMGCKSTVTWCDYSRFKGPNGPSIAFYYVCEEHRKKKEDGNIMQEEKKTDMIELLDAIKDVVEENIGMHVNEYNRANLVRDLATRLHRDGWRKP